MASHERDRWNAGAHFGPTFGWRDTVAVYDTFAPTENEYLAIAERSVVAGYEQAVGSARLE